MIGQFLHVVKKTRMATDYNKELFKYAVYYPVVFLRRQPVALYLKKLLDSQYMSDDELEVLQVHKLRKLIKYAKEEIPYYKEKVSDVSENEICNIDDLSYMPHVTKKMIQEHPGEFIGKKSPLFLTKKTTGGSTGEPVTVYKDHDAMAHELAATWRGYSWAGIDIGDRQGRFWGVPFASKDKLRAKLIDCVTNRKRCSAFSFDDKSLEGYTKMLTEFNPTYFYGYVSMLEEYAKYFERICKKPPFNLRCVITTSEVLTDYHRKLIEDVFTAPVFNEYGSGELGSVAHECEDGSLHVMAENMIVEVFDGERKCRPGEMGELVITELNNRAMPLIKYRTGDFAALSPQKCRCGRTLPVIENLAGRAYDIVVNRAGKLFHGEFFVYIFEEAKRSNLGVNAFQVQQITYDHIHIKVVPGYQYGGNTENYIKNKIQQGINSNTRVTIEKVESIEREPSGKMRVVVGMDNVIRSNSG